MDIDGLLGIVFFLLQWRVTVCLIGSTISAVALVNVFPWLTGVQGVVIALLGILPGLMWDAAATQKSGMPVSPVETTVTTAGLAAVIAGGAWGAISSDSLHSFLAGALIFAFSAWGWSWYVGRLQPPMASERVTFCVVLAAVAYATAALAVPTIH